MTERSEVQVRRIEAGDGPTLRNLRLAAIADSPETFTTTLAVAKDRTDVQWEEVAAAHASSTDQSTWFAEVDRSPAGMVSAFLTADGAVTMSALWAAPGFRGQGVADRLVDAVRRWATTLGARELRQWLVARNELSLAFHADLGFVPTGDERPFEPQPDLREVELRLPLEVEAG